AGLVEQRKRSGGCRVVELAPAGENDAVLADRVTGQKRKDAGPACLPVSGTAAVDLFAPARPVTRLGLLLRQRRAGKNRKQKNSKSAAEIEHHCVRGICLIQF